MREKHNMSKTKLYKSWCNMKGRCYRKSTKGFHRYGGRGIKVCDEWRKSFIAFKEWALQNGYREDLTLDRIDVNRNYEPSNCRWISNLEQQANRGNNRLITYNGETKALCEWARIYNLKWKTLQGRINDGWSIEKALNTSKLTYKDMIGKPKINSKKICQYSFDGTYIKTWDCLSQIENELGYHSTCVRECCLGRITKSYGYIWCYKEQKPNFSIYKRPQKHILQFDLDGNFIREYTSAYEAGAINNYCHNNIRSVCNGTRATYKKFIWKYK